MGSTGLIRKPENDNGSTDYHPWLTPEVFGKSGKGAECTGREGAGLYLRFRMGGAAGDVGGLQERG
jgi:hypothetical protein